MLKQSPAIVQHESALHPLLAVAALVGGAALVLSRRDRRPAVRVAGTSFGLACLAVAIRPLAFNGLREAGTQRRGAELNFSMVTDQPVAKVFAFFADFENFPKIVGGLREVRDTSDGRSHWCARTPAGGTLEWDAITTKFVTNSVIAWRSVLNAPVESTGVLRFRPEGDHTRIDVTVHYCVYDGHLRDALVALIRPTNGRKLEHDLRSYASAAG